MGSRLKPTDSELSHASASPRELDMVAVLSCSPLRQLGSLSPRDFWEALGVSKQGAMDLLRPLVEAGLIQREGTLKTDRYLLS